MNAQLRATFPLAWVAVHGRARRGPAAFTLLEMMVSVTILVVIIFSLYKMFDQTQRAFRGGVKLVDVMEGGRAATEYLARDLQLASGSMIPGYTNLLIRTNPATSALLLTNEVDGTPYYLALQEIFLITPSGRDWRGLGFLIGESGTNPVDLALLGAGAGSLYRFEVQTNTLVGGNLLYSFTRAAGSNQLGRLLDGVVGFRLRALDAAGNLLERVLPLEPMTSYRGTGNELPAYFDVELAVLSADILEPIKARVAPLADVSATFPSAVQMARLLLSQRAAQIQVYRQMIAVPSSQP